MLHLSLLGPPKEDILFVSYLVSESMERKDRRSGDAILGIHVAVHALRFAAIAVSADPGRAGKGIEVHRPVMKDLRTRLLKNALRYSS